MPVKTEGLTREQFARWQKGELKVPNEGLNVNPSLAFNPLPKTPPKAPPPVPK